jgi:hypothetical protein
MITRLSNGDVQLSLRPPLVYLDHWAVREISKSPARRDHFLETFRDRGTLMFSVLNIVEMGHNSGDSYTQIRALLDGVGPFWLLSDPDPATVQRRLAAGLIAPAAFLGFVQLFAQICGSMPDGELQLGTALDRLQDQAFRDAVEGMLTRPNLVRLLEYNRSRHRQREKMIPNPHAPGSPMWIELELLRFLVKDGKKITNNDAIDVMHAAVPLCFAPIVLFDTAWTNFARKLKLPDTQVYAQSDLDTALNAIRTIDTSRFRLVEPAVPQVIKA